MSLFISFIANLREIIPIRDLIMARTMGKNNVKALIASKVPKEPKNFTNDRVVVPNPAKETGMSETTTASGEYNRKLRNGIFTPKARSWK